MVTLPNEANNGGAPNTIALMMTYFLLLVAMTTTGTFATRAITEDEVAYMISNGLGLEETTGGSEPNRPNIVFIMVDDLGYADVGYHSEEAYTPTIDKLAREGVKLENYYVQPICTPSRSTFLSGRSQIHTGLQHKNLGRTQPNALPLDSATLPERLKTAGYSTDMVGKWHLGYYSPDYLPTSRGFDSFYGMYLGSGSHYSHRVSARGNKKAPLDLHNDTATTTQPDHNQNGVYSTHLYTQEATRVIRNRAREGSPFFLFLSYQTVHGPQEVPNKYRKIVQEKWNEKVKAGISLSRRNTQNGRRGDGRRGRKNRNGRKRQNRRRGQRKNRIDRRRQSVSNYDNFNDLVTSNPIESESESEMPELKVHHVEVLKPESETESGSAFEDGSSYEVERVKRRAGRNRGGGRRKNRGRGRKGRGKGRKRPNRNRMDVANSPEEERKSGQRGQQLGKQRLVHLAQALTVDEGVETIVQTLKDQGVWNNTVLVFTTDNGGITRLGGSNAPLRGGKGFYYEGGIRGVGFVNSPLLEQSGVTNNEMIHISDWFPTFVAMADGTLNNTRDVNGFNQWETISSGSPSPRHEILFNIDPKTKKGDQRFEHEFDTRIVAAFRKGDYKIITGTGLGKSVSLFNIKEDPTEQNDLAESPQFHDKVVEMLDDLVRYQKTAVPVRYPPNLKVQFEGVIGPWTH